MKAKTYYIHASAPHRIERTVANRGRNPGWIKVHVIKSSDIDKLVDRAAKALCRSRGCRWHGKSWIPATKINQDAWRSEARAMFKSIGLLP